MTDYKTYICGPSDCPNDSAFEHDNYFGCIPKDFNQRTGLSKTFRQHPITVGSLPSGEPDKRYKWNGGCDAQEAAQ